MNKFNPVVHFEFPAEDMERIKKFYETAFGWKMEQMGAEMGNYVVVQTAETDEKGMIKTPGTINGGFYKKTADPMTHNPSVVVAVENIQEAMEKVKAAGGTVHGGSKHDGQPEEIPGVGVFCSITDTEGNRISMLQPLPRQ
jgi:predicted enzyme related to lactoylglutathione lyase